MKICEIAEEYKRVYNLVSKDEIKFILMSKDSKLIGIKSWGELSYVETFIIECEHEFNDRESKGITIRYKIEYKEYKELMKREKKCLLNGRKMKKRKK